MGIVMIVLNNAKTFALYAPQPENRLTHAKTPTFREKTAKVLPLFSAVNIPRPLFSHSDRMLRGRVTTWKISEIFINVRSKTPEVRINARKHCNLRKHYAVQFSLLLPPCGPFFLNLTLKTGPHDNRWAIIAEVI